MLKKLFLLLSVLKAWYLFFSIIWRIQKWKRTAFEIEILCNIINVFIVTFDTLSQFLLNKSFNLKKIFLIPDFSTALYIIIRLFTKYNHCNSIVAVLQFGKLPSNKQNKWSCKLVTLWSPWCGLFCDYDWLDNAKSKQNLSMRPIMFKSLLQNTGIMKLNMSFICISFQFGFQCVHTLTDENF